MEIRFSAHPQDFKSYNTARIREQFLIENLMTEGRIKFVYSHYDRFITGGAVPTTENINLKTYDPLKSEYFLERREMGIINVGAKGIVHANGQSYMLENKECLYIGKGVKEVSFESRKSIEPAKFYLTSAPAHKEYPIQKFTLADAAPLELGSAETANERTVYKFIHQKGIQSCQLVMGMTLLKPGSVWNTMPTHLHDRRMEVYFYFDLPANQKVLHLMGDPAETRHMVVSNEQAIISPDWSIHSGAGTHNYSFIWAMAGENTDYSDMDLVDINNLR
jgi:4-deoxy-L-threo-5-hexosulose-uronate ketol-isomerase